ncbi:MAG: HDOD domain-containing protein [candidate division Zixibacteria bacterium]|nr:HDOD domain-containing protein [candidate division Zixibacteria bacterium]
MQDYQLMIDRMIELPSPPLVVHRLQEVFSREEISGHDIAKIVEIDQSFTARVLRLVNSPFYGFTRKIVLIEEAVTMLGINAIQQLLLTTSLLGSFKKADKSIKISGFWIHSFGVAVIAKALLSHRDKDTQSEVFMGGILHDIGRLVYLRLDPDRFLSFYVGQDMAPDLAGERGYFGIDHQMAGYMLAQKWNFPKGICDIIKYHHQPIESPLYLQTASAVHIADIICHGFAISHQVNFYITEYYPEAWKAINLSYGELEKRLAKALMEFENSVEAFLESD